MKSSRWCLGTDIHLQLNTATADSLQANVCSTASAPPLHAVITLFGNKSTIIIIKRDDKQTDELIEHDEYSQTKWGVTKCSWKREMLDLCWSCRLRAGGNEEAWHCVVVSEEYASTSRVSCQLHKHTNQHNRHSEWGKAGRKIHNTLWLKCES